MANKYSQGSIIYEADLSHPRRYEVLGVENEDYYRVRALFSSLEPDEFLWPIERCDAWTKLEWQKPSRDTVVYDPSAPKD